MNLTKSTKVLDIRRGIGRWAKTVAPLVHKYHGTDLMPNLLILQKKRVKKYEI